MTHAGSSRLGSRLSCPDDPALSGLSFCSCSLMFRLALVEPAEIGLLIWVLTYCALGAEFRLSATSSNPPTQAVIAPGKKLLSPSARPDGAIFRSCVLVLCPSCLACCVRGFSCGGSRILLSRAFEVYCFGLCVFHLDAGFAVRLRSCSRCRSLCSSMDGVRRHSDSLNFRSCHRQRHGFYVAWWAHNFFGSRTNCW